MKKSDIIKRLNEKGLKVTPQRIGILEAINMLNNHPTADQILEYIRIRHPNISTATVYKVMEKLVEKQMVRKVNTDKNTMRYDGVSEKHHHLYCAKTEKLVDYVDTELDELLKEYFKKKNINEFKIEDIVVQIRGTFD